MEGEWLFKSSLLTLVTKLVHALGNEAHALTPLCIELLGESLTGHVRRTVPRSFPGRPVNNLH